MKIESENEMNFFFEMEPQGYFYRVSLNYIRLIGLKFQIYIENNEQWSMVDGRWKIEIIRVLLDFCSIQNCVYCVLCIIIAFENGIFSISFRLFRYISVRGFFPLGILWHQSNRTSTFIYCYSIEKSKICFKIGSHPLQFLLHYSQFLSFTFAMLP